jgi:hypothetical protein
MLLVFNLLFAIVIVILLVFDLVIFSCRCKILKLLVKALKLHVFKCLIYLISNNFLYQYRNYLGIFFLW